MQLLNFENAQIDKAKITDYLLSEKNSDGKLRFFMAFGFTITNWKQLRDALQQHAKENPITSTHTTKYGIKYTIEAPIHTPSGRSPHIRSVWIIDTGKQTPRFITAYPLQGKYDDKRT